MSGPLEIEIKPARPRVLAGEGVVLRITQRTHAELEMETVELNGGRTQVVIEDRATGTGRRVVTGSDHVKLHGVHPLVPPGRFFHAPAGSAWESELQLLDWTRPLPTGRFALQIGYQYGTTSGETAWSNVVEVEVAAAVPVGITRRWFGGNQSRELLGSIAILRDGTALRTLLQLARAGDPSVLLFGTDLEVALPPGSRPVLAHMNDISFNQFHRWIVWADERRLGVVRAHPGGRLGPPLNLEHGLDAARLADPPLQLRNGGLLALVTGTEAGGSPAGALIGLDEKSVPRVPIRFSLPGVTEKALVIWEEPERGTGVLVTNGSDGLFRTRIPGSSQSAKLDVSGVVRAMAADQWRGRGTVLVLAEKEGELQICAWPSDSTGSVPEPRATYHGSQLPAPITAGPTDAVPLSGGADLALLFDIDREHFVLCRGEVIRTHPVPVPAGLVSSPSGLFLVGYDGSCGPIAAKIADTLPGKG